MTSVALSTIGLEEVQRAAYFQLFENLNEAVTEIETTWAVSDEDFATRTGTDYVPTTLEPIDPANFYEGHRPSLIRAPIENYPNVSVSATRATPGINTDMFDHQDLYRNVIWVEIMVKASNEEEVNRRIMRTADAANSVMLSDPTLGGTIHGFDASPSLIISDVFTRKERSAYGAEWLWQGARLEYAVRKEAVRPSTSTGSFFRAAGYDIDQ